MTDLNNVTLVCRVTQEIGENDFGYISTGTAKLQLHVANNESRKKGEKWEDEVSYFDITVWGKPAESLKQKIRKGLLVAVSGRLKQDRWEKDGQKKSRIYINADSVQILEKAETKPAENNDGFPEDFPFN